MIFWIGLYPQPFLSRIEPTTQVFLERLSKAGATRHMAQEDRIAPGPLASREVAEVRP